MNPQDMGQAGPVAYDNLASQPGFVIQPPEPVGAPLAPTIPPASATTVSSVPAQAQVVDDGGGEQSFEIDHGGHHNAAAPIAVESTQTPVVEPDSAMSPPPVPSVTPIVPVLEAPVVVQPEVVAPVPSADTLTSVAESQQTAMPLPASNLNTPPQVAPVAQPVAQVDNLSQAVMANTASFEQPAPVASVMSEGVQPVLDSTMTYQSPIDSDQQILQSQPVTSPLVTEPMPSVNTQPTTNNELMDIFDQSPDFSSQIGQDQSQANVEATLQFVSPQPTVAYPAMSDVLPAQQSPVVNQGLQFTQPSNVMPAPVPSQSDTTMVAPQPMMSAMSQTYIDPTAIPTQEQQTPTKSKLIRKIAIGVGAAIVLIVAGIILKAQFFAGNPTQKDVDAANKSLQTITDDMDKIQQEITQITVTDDTGVFNNSYQTAKDQLADANKQATSLGKSRTLKSPGVDKAYQAFKPKWQGYSTFMADSLDDINALKPLVSSTNKELDGLAKAQAGVSTSDMVDKAKPILTDSTDKLNKLQLKTEGYKTIQQAYLKYLGVMMKGCNSASDSAENAQTCYLGTEASMNEYSNSLQTAAQSMTDQTFKYDPTGEITDYVSKLSDLSNLLKS